MHSLKKAELDTIILLFPDRYSPGHSQTDVLIMLDSRKMKVKVFRIKIFSNSSRKSSKRVKALESLFSHKELTGF